MIKTWVQIVSINYKVLCDYREVTKSSMVLSLCGRFGQVGWWTEHDRLAGILYHISNGKPGNPVT